MSLFKAYENVTSQSDEASAKPEWLENSSFEPSTIPSHEISSPSKSLDGLRNPLQNSDRNDLFIIDTKGDERLSTIDTLRGKAAPRFSNTVRPANGAVKKKKKSKRYSKTKKLESKPSEITLHEQDRCLRNRLIADEHNVELWKEFIKNQERYITVGNLKAITERQISIIDEALIKNPDNAELFDMWFSYNKKLYPYDDFAKVVIARTQKDSGNYFLWIGLIECTQQSVSECNVSVVLELYRKAISSFKKFRNQNILNKGVLFKLFHRMSVFLRQTGSWKELLYLLEYTLWLNCNDMEIANIFKFPEISQSNLIELEEAVLQSGLPLSEIWFRIESLRETFSWSTVDNSFKNMGCSLTIEEMDDLTTVFNDVEKFHLLIFMLEILRIPILPNRQSINDLLGINEIAWHSDSSEIILPIFYDSEYEHTDLVTILYDKLVTIADGPQFWGPRPFTTEYYEFTLSLIKNLMDYSKDDSTKIAFGVLYIRLIRLHVVLVKNSKKEINSKSIKKRIKTFLSENNNLTSSVLLYVEYAKVEILLTGLSAGLNMLKVLLESTDNTHGDYLYLIRTYISFQLMNQDGPFDKMHCINLLRKLVDDEEFSETNLPRLIEKFHHNPYISETYVLGPSLLLPNCCEDWFYCGAYFIYFTAGLEKAVSYMKSASENVSEIIKEGLYEWSTSLIHDSNNIRYVQDYLKEGIDMFPNNSKLLLAYISCTTQWMKMKPVLSRSLFGTVLLASYARLQSQKYPDSCDKAAYTNREISVLSDATLDPVLQEYPFIWKLYLQTLYESGSDKIMDIMTQALEKFPWLKALYVSGVRYAPQEHSSFQDIITEKELTLLALPEELDILREDNPD